MLMLLTNFLLCLNLWDDSFVTGYILHLITLLRTLPSCAVGPFPTISYPILSYPSFLLFFAVYHLSRPTKHVIDQRWT